MRLRAAVLGAGCFGALIAPHGASARPAVAIDGGTLVFYPDTLLIVARDGASLRLSDGAQARADAASFDLKTDRVVLAGHARIMRGEHRRDGDAIALDIDTGGVDVLNVYEGTAATTLDLGDERAARVDEMRFAFPDVDDTHAYIRSKHARITPHADVRFSPAAFPTSVGALPMPAYLYTYATAAGFRATSLGSAAFDQPYGLWGTATSLTALHARWLEGTGPAVALQQHVVAGDEAFVVASIDSPLHAAPVRGLDGYRRLGGHSALTVDASSGPYGWSAGAALTTALRPGLLRVAFGAASAGFSTADVRLRTPDRPLLFGSTWSVLGDAGYDALRGGLIGVVPDRRSWSTIWRHGIDASVATPIVRAPFATRMGATLDVKRTWYDYPHHRDDVFTNLTLSREFSRKIAAFASYATDWSHDVYPNAQTVFYPPTLLPPVAPDGTPWADRAAFKGAGMTRGETLSVQLTPDSNTSVRVGMTHHADFPQFHGWGAYPPWLLRADARFRPFPNIGIDVGRSYEFAWGGTRWVPRWSFAITP